MENRLPPPVGPYVNTSPGIKGQNRVKVPSVPDMKLCTSGFMLSKMGRIGDLVKLAIEM